jgi:glucosamine 6-phosphate synthetase-like amidotransferase/phosphosugar isomerase protein
MPGGYCPQGHYDKISNIQEIKSRSGRIMVVTKGDTQVRELADFVIEIPETSDALSPLIQQQYLYNFILSYSGDEV